MSSLDLHATDGPALEFRNVSISFDGLKALDNISFKVLRGEMLCITGDSCSGKSVLLRLALGFLQPDDGQILIESRDISHMDETDLLALRGEMMGMVFQENSLFSGLTVYENAAYRLRDHDWSEERVQQAVIEILTFVGLENELDKQVEELSGGMKRRLELARALIGWPRIMLFDEPNAGLDPINARQVLDLIIRARDIHQISSLYVTKALQEIPYLARHHVPRDSDDGLVAQLADDRPGTRVLLLEEGRAAFYGTPREFTTSSLPAAKHMLHPMTDALHGEVHVADPWARLGKEFRGERRTE